MNTIKQSYKIKHLYDPTIKVGDEVKLIDGSALTLLHKDGRDFINVTDNIYIVDSYFRLTGIDLPLKDIKATVIETDIKDTVTTGFVAVYVQDIIVQIGTATFRTCSQLVRKDIK